MQAAIKLDVDIPPDHRLEIAVPEELPTGPAEVIVLSRQRVKAQPRASFLGMDEGKGWVADDFDAPLPEDLRRLFEGEG